MSLWGASRWFTIPAHRPFAEDLAQGLYDALSPLGPDALSQATVLTPTRRGARALADAFVRAGGGRAVLPPQMRPLGDLEQGEPPFEPGDLALDLPAAIDPLLRRFELMRLTVELADHIPGGVANASAALDLADALGGFLDSLQIEEVEAAGKLDALVAGDLAEHWQVSRVFLDEALARWPRRLDSLGVVDVSERRVRLLRRLAAAWRARPPKGVLIAAGSTGTAPATRDLLIAISEAPQGFVVMPGLDQDLADAAWAKVDVQHPQGALRRLLDEARITRSDVAVWPASAAPDAAGRWRRRVINEALRPAEQTADWLRVIADLEAEDQGAVAQGLAGLSLVTARTEDEAANAAALLLREALETPELTCALVTPDQNLARRVAARLARWGIVPDSSAGVSLAGCPCGVLAGLLAKLAADPLHPVAQLAVLKHPYARLGDAAVLEARALRGVRAPSWDVLKTRLAKTLDAIPQVERLQAIVESLSAPDADSPSDAARRLTAAMEAVAKENTDLWSGHGGEAMARLLSGLIEQGCHLPHVTAVQFADLLSRLMEGETVRAGGATHPRLRILGAIEARLVRADRLVLAGLEEGVWPVGAPLDPFLSRPMRASLGLPAPERRIGLTAHDFAQAACAPEVILLHAERREGAPAVKSRWLWRLETLARGAGLKLPGRPEVLDWARNLDAPDEVRPAARPAPRPPLDHRPRKLYVTRIEALTRDPYAVWARDILRLEPLARPDQPVDVRIRGTAIHEAFEKLALNWPADAPDTAASLFEGLYIEFLMEGGLPPESLPREKALAREAGVWVADLETKRRADGRSVHVERRGEILLDVAGRPFVLAAKADRIEIDADCLGHVLDFKTGTAPTAKMVRSGFSPQLTLTAAILAGGGFSGLPKARVGELTYVSVTGRRPAGKVEVRARLGGDGKDNTTVLDSTEAVLAARDGLIALIAKFDDPAHGYASRIAPQFRRYPSDYDHLARLFEWSADAEDDE